jgi:hypothetical protein
MSGSQGSSGGDKPKEPTGSGSGQSTEKEHKPVLNDNGEWVYEDTGEPVDDADKKDSGSGGMANPEGPGTDEGIDEDWWRSLPSRDAFSALGSGPQVDEREGTVSFSLADLGGQTNLESLLRPSPITVDPGGEGLTIDLAHVQSRGGSTGTTTADGWGDKARTMAEALAEPRIRDGAVSRY